MLFCLTAVDAQMLFEVVFVFECFPTLQTFELPGFQALIHHDRTLGRHDIVIRFMLEQQLPFLHGCILAQEHISGESLFQSHLVLHLIVKRQVPLHLSSMGGRVPTVGADHVAPLPLLTVLDVVPQRGSSLIHPLAERTSLLGSTCIWSPERKCFTLSNKV